ncbi:MAG: YraN family protein [Opitutales bacterium]
MKAQILNIIEYFKKFFKKPSRNYILGKNAEKFAIKYIKWHTPYKFVYKNYRYKNFEVDILAYNKKDNCLLIVEVKSRHKDALVSGYLAAMVPSKINSVIKCKNAFMRDSPHEFTSFSYNIFEVIHDDNGKIIEHYFHENIPIPKRRNTWQRRY